VHTILISKRLKYPFLVHNTPAASAAVKRRQRDLCREKREKHNTMQK